MISYRDKSLINADRVLPSTVTRAFCCQHLKENFTVKFGRALDGLFWKIARATRVESFELGMQELLQAKPAAEAYLRGVEPQLWSTAHFPEIANRYGHDTSNIVESTNKTLKIDRELSLIQLLDAIWTKLMTERYTRLENANKPNAGAFTKLCLQRLALQRPWACTNIVNLSSPTTACIEQPNGHVYLVDIGAGTCTCKHYQENRIPCGHAIAFILRINRPQEQFLPAILSVPTWRATYTTNLNPVDICHLEISPDIFPPFTRQPRGRPRKERVRVGEARQRSNAQQRAGGLPEPAARALHHCHTCSNAGHNSATCSKPHD